MIGYVAHPFDARQMIREWELIFEKATGIDLLNPFYDLERSDVEEIEAGRAGRYEKLDPVRIVTRDVDAIHRSDFVVAWVTGDLSYGTIQEIVYAYMAHIPVYIICTNGHEDHPWLRYHATHVFTDAMQFENYMRKHHGQKS